MAVRAVIVGNGVAGIEAARTLQSARPDAQISIVSEESDHFFSRTALMYVLSGQMRYRDIEPHSRALYSELGVERVRKRALGIEGRTLLLEGAPALPFDVLLLACGSSPRPPPWPGSGLRGIGHFVTLQDLEWLEGEVHGRSGADRPPRAELLSRDPGSPYRARPRGAGKALAPIVIGGGLIGIEVIETLLAAKRKPRFVIKDRWFWPVALDARESGWVAEALRAHGVEVDLGVEVERFVDDGTGAVGRAVIGGKEVPCDLAVVAIGVVPNVAWLGPSGPRIAGGGIAVDTGLETSIQGVFAAGDCASVPSADGGEPRPEQLWYTARDQGRIAGKRMAGLAATYARGTWYNSAKLMDIEYTTVGHVPPSHRPSEGLTDVFHEEKGRVRSTTRLVLENDRVVGFNALGRRWDHSVIAEWIEAKKDLGFVRANLRKAAFDTELVPPLEW